MRNQPDETLLALYAEGNDSAFDELLNRYQQKLYTYILSVVQNRELTEDIFQDTFAKVIATVRDNRYKEMGRFVGFLFRVAHNRIIDHYRQAAVANNITEDDAGYDIFNNQQLASPSFEEKVSEEQIVLDIRRLIRFLPVNQREIIVMRYYREMSFKEISDILGVSINTALGRVRYAILNMRKMAEEHGIELTV